MKRVLWSGAALVTVLALALGGLRWWLGLGVAPLGGRESLAGLGDSVVVLWDSLAVPHVAARSVDDLFAALGYLHARDRMWEMDLLRHAAEGRLSELFGTRTVATDRSLRLLELRRIARTTARGLSPESQRALAAYARGVNAWLAHGPRALEFRLLGHTPESWRPEHSIEIGRLEAWDLRTPGPDRPPVRAARPPGAAAAALLAPSDPDSGPTIMSPGPWRGGPPRAPGTRRPPAPTNARRAPASNSWVLGPRRTASHKPILANDPHLTLRAPSIWYLVGAHAPGYEVVGATIPGIPAVILGHTARLAWGFTNAMVEDVDYFVEALSLDSTRYRTARGWANVVVVAETIAVRGGRPVVYLRRDTADGPLLERPVGDSGPPLAMRWVAQDASDEFGALLGMGRATDLRSFATALVGFRSPEQNVVYADTTGTIAYFLAGHVPLRRGGAVGEPQPGWAAAGKWERYLTAGELPHFANPPEGFIVTANNRVTGPEYPFFLSDAWDRPYRAQRIHELIWRDSVATVQSVARDQLDIVDVFCRAVARRAARVARAAGYAELGERLAAWDGAMTPDRAEPTIVWSWYRAFERLVAAAVSPTERPAAPERPSPPGGRSPGPRVAALERAALEQVLPRVAQLPWGVAHQTIERHPLGAVALLRFLVRFDIGPLATPGDSYTVNAAASDDSAPPFHSSWGPSLRHVVDLGDVDGGGGFILPAGQSGHPFSPHYRDQTERWLRGELWLLPLDLRKVAAQARLVLVPGGR
ncbi:MAG TPA: penicillin acylase family protein [Gemmatimonadales bacterium]|nr:penicillin acylase family protein [Gemmatimonadales bacterium]